MTKSMPLVNWRNKIVCSAPIPKLVGNHIDAKRNNIYKDPSYYDQMPEGSKRTFACQDIILKILWKHVRTGSKVSFRRKTMQLKKLAFISTRFSKLEVYSSIPYTDGSNWRSWLGLSESSHEKFGKVWFVQKIGLKVRHHPQNPKKKFLNFPEINSYGMQGPFLIIWRNNRHFLSVWSQMNDLKRFYYRKDLCIKRFYYPKASFLNHAFGMVIPTVYAHHSMPNLM